MGMPAKNSFKSKKGNPRTGGRAARAAGRELPGDAPGIRPDVSFHKQMTAGKRAVLAASLPLSWPVGDNGGAKRTRDDMSDDAAANVDPAARRAKKRAKGGPSEAVIAAEREALRATRKARRIEKKAARAAGDAKGDALPGAGVVYVGHVPHGFYEKQMTAFFTQFGGVSRVKLSRSRETAGSRGYAFVEFTNEEVAKIAAEAMDGYLMHGRALVAKFVPSEQVHERTFDGAEKEFKRIPWATIERKRNLTAARKPEKLGARVAAIAKAHKSTQDRLTALGITYKFPIIA
jgi:nucleolar protein 15